MVEIIPYTKEYAEAFKQINFDWIGQYFEIEDIDRRILENPQKYILDKGGHILIALLDGKPVGTTALIKISENSYELAKMGVMEAARGKKIGRKLGETAIKIARKYKAEKLWLETNGNLKAAIALYKKIGFKEVTKKESPYSRCNIQMTLVL